MLAQRVCEALGRLAGSAREVGVGLGVLAELLEEELVDVTARTGKHDPEREAVQHGHESGQVTPGGRRVQVDRPAIRSAEGREEVCLQTYEHFADRDPLSRAAMERMIASVSTGRYTSTGRETGGSVLETKTRSTSKPSVPRTLVARTREALGELMSRCLDDVRLRSGSLRGSIENATVTTAPLSNPVERGLNLKQGIPFVTDSAKALRKAIHSVFDEVPVPMQFATKSYTRSNTSSSAPGWRKGRGSPASCHGYGAREATQSSGKHPG